MAQRQERPANRDLVRRYLEAQLAAWDLADRSVAASGAVTGADDALRGARLLAVLGEPGPERTRLALRYARRAAAAALERLRCGAHLEDVELPLFTTWGRWSRTDGAVHDSLIRAGLDAWPGARTDSSDPADGADDRDRAVAQVRRRMSWPGQRVLAVVDALDEEAGSGPGQAPWLLGLAVLPRWRAVLTSSPAAWAAAVPRVADLGAGTRVVAIEPTRHPQDLDAPVGAEPATLESGTLESATLECAPAEPVAPAPRRSSAELLGELRTAFPMVAPDLVVALCQLDLTDTERRQARTCVLEILADAEPTVATRLLWALPALDPTVDERRTAAARLLDVLEVARPVAAVRLLGLLPSLVLGEEDRRSARARLRELLETADPQAATTACLAHALHLLGSPTDRPGPAATSGRS